MSTETGREEKEPAFQVGDRVTLRSPEAQIIAVWEDGRIAVCFAASAQVRYFDPAELVLVTQPAAVVPEPPMPGSPLEQRITAADTDLAKLTEQFTGPGGWVERFDAQLRELATSARADYALVLRVETLEGRARGDSMMADAGEAALHRSIEDQIKQLNELRAAFADSERTNLDLRAEIDQQRQALSRAGDVNMGRQKTINQLTRRVDHLESQIDQLACYLLQHHPGEITEDSSVEVAIRLLEQAVENASFAHPADRLYLLNDDDLVAVAQRADALCHERGLPCAECPERGLLNELRFAAHDMLREGLNDVRLARLEAALHKADPCPQQLGMRPPLSAMELITAERKRQVEVKGWTPDHDDSHERGELARAAASYAIPAEHREIAFRWIVAGFVPVMWPWSDDTWKPGDRIEELTKAGALIVAEIERLQRIEGGGLPCTSESRRALGAEQRQAVVGLADVLGMRSGGDVPAAAKAAERVGGPGQADRNDHAAGAQSSGNTLADADDAPAPALRPTPSESSATERITPEQALRYLRDCAEILQATPSPLGSPAAMAQLITNAVNAIAPLVNCTPPAESVTRYQLDDGGGLDEIVTTGGAHLEVLDRGSVYLRLGPVAMILTSRKRIWIRPRECASWREELLVTAPDVQP